MKTKRILTGVLGFPFVVALLVFGNNHVINIAFSIVALMAVREFFNAFNKKVTCVKWVRIYCFSRDSFFACDSRRIYVVGVRCSCASDCGNIVYASNCYKDENNI